MEELLLLPKARKLGIDRVLVTCDDDNIASARTIEANGGVLENKLYVESEKQTVRRYWIDL
ncbi:MAG: GNAT family N-acetyltransferase [Aristaeellaceae bacterium]